MADTQWEDYAVLTAAPVDADTLLILDTTATPPSAGQVKQIDLPLAAKYFASKAFGKALVPANNFCVGDGVTDDTAGMEAAVAAVFAGAGLGLGGVYCPDQYLVKSSINCTSATMSAAGQGISLVGADRQASQVIKDFTGALITYNGNGGSDGNHSAFGGLRNITLNGNANTGPLLQTNSAQQMFFENTSFISNADKAFDFTTMEDSYFVACTSNNCGSTTAPVLSIQGSSSGTSNMIWFIQCRFEAFLNGAVWIKQGTGNTDANNGFFFNQCKFETSTVHGDLIVADGATQQLLIDQPFFALDAFASGYSTPAACVSFGGSTATGGNQFSLTNTWVHAASGVLDSVVNTNGASSALTGPYRVNGVTGDETPVTAVLVFNGCGGLDVNWDAIDMPGDLVAGDGSYYNPNSTNVAMLGGGMTLQGSLPAATGAPALGGFYSGMGVAGNTSGTGTPIFGVLNSTEDGSGGGIGTTAFLVSDDDTAYHKGVVSLAGGTDTSGTAVASSPAFATTVAKQLSTTQDVILYLAVQTSAALAVSIGPTSSTTTALMPSKSYALGLITIRIPQGWFVKLTGTISDLIITQVTC